VTDPKDDADGQDDENLEDEDTLDEGDAKEPETPDDAEQPNTDWEARYREQAKLHGRQEAELAIWRRGEQPTGRHAAAEPDEGDEAGDGEYVARLEADSWRTAEALYGEVAIEAYEAAFAIYERAQTPADHIAAFEAYHDIRSKGGSPADAAAAAGEGKKRTRADAVQPRVDLNQSDAGPDLNADKNVAEARKSGDLKKFVSAAVGAMGFGGEPRR
jgi:hypothetical protein